MLLVATVLSLVPVVNSPVSPVALELAAAKKSGELSLVVRNTDRSAVNVNIGITLANGSDLLPTNVRLTLERDGRKSDWTYTGRIAGVAGRIDDFILPLMPGASYQMTFAFSDFGPLEGIQHTLQPGHYRVRASLWARHAEHMNSDTEGMKLMKLWTGVAESNEITVDYSAPK